MRISETTRGLPKRWPSVIFPLALLGSSLVANALTARQPQGRLMPPSGLKCDRNDLTVYDGRVLTYRRRHGSTFLRIRTSFDSIEAVRISHPGIDDPSEFYLLNGEPFTKSDWQRIETRKKLLRSGILANVWVCRGNPTIQPVVDWRTGETPAKPMRSQ